MSCRYETFTYTLPDGTTETARAIVCRRGDNPARTCVVCHRGDRSATLKFCDYPLSGDLRGQACSRVICTLHATHREPDLDYCPAHGRLIDKEASYAASQS